MSELVTVRQFSELVGVSEVNVRRSIDRGRIKVVTKNGRMLLDKEQALKDWEANRDVSQDRRDAGGESSAKFAEVRIQKVEIESEYKRLKVQEMNRRLVARDEVEEAIASANALVRERILSVGVRCAAEWAGITDPVELQVLVERELQSCLEHLCDSDFATE